MYTIMVVDDEPLVRLALKTLTDWENHGFRVEYEAANGKQALMILDGHPEIDIILTDINMPVMDGLDLIAELKKRGRVQNIIVLSAYNDYNLVRQAFKLGVQDYVLKTELEPENMIALLTGITRQFEEARRKAGEKEHHQIKYLKEELLRESLLPTDTPLTYGLFSDGEIRLGEKNLVLCFLWVDDYGLVVNRYGSNSLKSLIEAVTNAIGQILDENKQGEILALSPEEYVLFLSFRDRSQLQAREKLLEILGRIRHSLSNYLNLNVSIGVSSLRDGYEEIPRLYQEAEANARLRFIFGKNRTIFPEDAQKMSEIPGKSIIADGAGLIAALKEGDREKVAQELNGLFEIIGKVKTSKLEKIYPYYMEIVFLLAAFVSEKGEDLAEILGIQETGFYTKITGFETQAEVKEWIAYIVDQIYQYFAGKKDSKMIRAIARAQEFIKNNFMQDLTLKMASDYVGLSESHFSYLFAKTTGESFIDYLTRLRIEKAKELIGTTNLKIYEIALQVGYTSTEHFSRVFKKLTGISPNLYKNS
ncbi:MAG: response regulator [Firmicutes bacterium]|nr:response regulator [Bacillota bacterium]